MDKKGQMSQSSNFDQSRLAAQNEEWAFSELFHYFSAKEALLDDSDIRLIEQYGEFRSITKGNFLHNEGMIANYTFFVVQGLFRLFTRNEDGEELNLQFSAENGWINDYESYISCKPSKNFIEALENSKIIAFKKDDFKFIIQESIPVQNLVQKLIIKNILRNKDRLLLQLSDSPQERYEDFLMHYPDIHYRIPLYMIASYIGVSRKTLTRIRGGR